MMLWSSPSLRLANQTCQFRSFSSSPVRGIENFVHMANRRMRQDMDFCQPTDLTAREARTKLMRNLFKWGQRPGTLDAVIPFNDYRTIPFAQIKRPKYAEDFGLQRKVKDKMVTIDFSLKGSYISEGGLIFPNGDDWKAANMKKYEKYNPSVIFGSLIVTNPAKPERGKVYVQFAFTDLMYEILGICHVFKDTNEDGSVNYRSYLGPHVSKTKIEILHGTRDYIEQVLGLNEAFWSESSQLFHQCRYEATEDWRKRFLKYLKTGDEAADKLDKENEIAARIAQNKSASADGESKAEEASNEDDQKLKEWEIQALKEFHEEYPELAHINHVMSPYHAEQEIIKLKKKKAKLGVNEKAAMKKLQKSLAKKKKKAFKK